MSGWQALAYFSMQLLVLSTSQPALSQAYRQDKQTNSWRGEEKKKKSDIHQFDRLQRQ